MSRVEVLLDHLQDLDAADRRTLLAWLAGYAPDAVALGLQHLREANERGQAYDGAGWQHCTAVVALPARGHTAHLPSADGAGYACARPAGATPPDVITLPVGELLAAWQLCTACWPAGRPQT